jgi:predicted CoA-substrate-specific enzyme activase
MATMNVTEVITEELIDKITADPVIGIDIGSRTAKGVLLADGKIYTAIIQTKVDMEETVDEIFSQLLKSSKLKRTDIVYVIGTGYGRIALNFEDIPKQVVTEISCHAMGAHYLNVETRTIIDIGGQDSKAIKVDTNTGKVVEFIMNDKCAAGTGRFLERVAELLDLTIDELGEAALKADKPSLISSQCVVFAESEIISLRAKKERKENIAAGIHLATARRVRNLLNRIGLEPNLVFTGGVSKNIGMKRALEELLGHPITDVKMDLIYAGALGAAIFAQQYATETLAAFNRSESSFKLNLAGLNNRIAKYQEEVVNKSGDDRKRVGYLCTYTPLEILNAAGVAHLRIFQAGDTDTVAGGELLTQSVFCDFTKSCLGGFSENNPLYSALDKVYSFYTCDSMKKVAEAMNEFFVPTSIFVLPRLPEKEASHVYFQKELRNFRADLERLIDRKISDEEIGKQIVVYNQVRSLVRKISELRKQSNPPLSGLDFLDLTKAYFYLPPEELLVIYQDVYNQLKAAPQNEGRQVRLMMAGGIVADGDRRLLEIVEKEIGARIVVDDHCTGLSPFYYPVPEDEDPFMALASGYLKQAPCARMSPLEARLKFSGDLARDYKVDGVLYYYLKFCPSYGLTKNEFLRHFQKLDIPVLEIPSDYSQSDQGQLKTRVEAFIEVLGEGGTKKDGSQRVSQSA